jgi:hypothetical protein
VGIGTAITVLKDWESRGWAPVLFGGVVRDLFVLGSRRYPRDIDVVLSNAGTDEVIGEFSGEDYRQNRFGGLHLNVARWSFDVWPLSKTWAFTTDASLSPSAENLPKTTFLDVEAIAVTLDGPNKIGQIYSNGFFRSVMERSIDINYARNPYPSLAAIRSIMTAYKLHFQISRRLAEYITLTISEAGIRSLVDAQEQHYRRVLFREADIGEIFKHFVNQLASDDRPRVNLPERYWPRQLGLWRD